MKMNGLGKGLSALIPNELKDDFKENQDNGFNEFDNETNEASSKERNKGSFQNKIEIELESENGKENRVKEEEKEKINKGGKQIVEIELEKIVVDKNQPRKEFDQDKLEGLAKSINQYGLLNPITVRRKNDDEFEIVAGERRFRAANLAGLKKIPAIVKKVDKTTQLELALIENIQREDLNPLEEALAYKTLLKEFGLTQDELASRVGKSRPVITNTIRYLNLPEEIQEGLIKGKISEGHAKVLLGVEDPQKQMEFYEVVSKNKLTVRNLERIITQAEEERLDKVDQDVNPIIVRREKRLSDILGVKVKIKPKVSGRGGRITLEYFSDDDMERIMSLIKETD